MHSSNPKAVADADALAGAIDSHLQIEPHVADLTHETFAPWQQADLTARWYRQF